MGGTRCRETANSSQWVVNSKELKFFKPKEQSFCWFCLFLKPWKECNAFSIALQKATLISGGTTDKQKTVQTGIRSCLSPAISS